MFVVGKSNRWCSNQIPQAKMKNDGAADARNSNFNANAAAVLPASKVDRAKLPR